MNVEGSRGTKRTQKATHEFTRLSRNEDTTQKKSLQSTTNTPEQMRRIQQTIRWTFGGCVATTDYRVTALVLIKSVCCCLLQGEGGVGCVAQRGVG